MIVLHKLTLSSKRESTHKSKLKEENENKKKKEINLLQKEADS